MQWLGWAVGIGAFPGLVLAAHRGATARLRMVLALAATAALLDQEVFTVSGSGMDVKIPLRCLFVLSGMGFLLSQPPAGEIVRVSATDSWLRLDSRFGAVVRRRHALLPLLV